jgi:hypothetical protein
MRWISPAMAVAASTENGGAASTGGAAAARLAEGVEDGGSLVVMILADIHALEHAERIVDENGGRAIE